jgi:hypothetical protein
MLFINEKKKMAKLNSQYNDNFNHGGHEDKNAPNGCELIKNDPKWTANVSFIPYNNEQRDRAYKVWVRLFLKTRNMKS